MLNVALEGYAYLLSDLVKKFGSVELPPLILSFTPKWMLGNVRDKQGLENLLQLLKHRLLIDLSPNVDECYGLGPYSVFDVAEERSNAKYGELINQAKYRRRNTASREIERELLQFVRGHQSLQHVNMVAAPPKLNLNAQNLPRNWASMLSDSLGIPLVSTRKTRDTGEQKNIPENSEELGLVKQLAHSMVVESRLNNADVLIVDDTLRSGGTMIELGWALKESGARRVYGVCIAKDAKGTRGGIDLHKDSW